MKMKFCVACFSDKNLHHHHLVPKVKGGSDDQTNLITLCGYCHAKIHNLKDVWSADHKQIQRIGIENAKLLGKYKGRKSKLTDNQLELMKLEFIAKVSPTKIAKKYGITRAYVYQLCR